MLNAIVIAIRLSNLVFSGHKQIVVENAAAPSAVGRLQASIEASLHCEGDDAPTALGLNRAHSPDVATKF